ncbi:hypothetical protein Gotri_021115 [Gossypium trilobum]|uniref:RNase H type-1 domain-containing protein n=1 Tax=Gossypium trilobum TaxID=34281 RepID=A0A7J9DBP6_9ROSI|nr:hypothetical protein [Gossypium trilobum]
MHEEKRRTGLAIIDFIKNYVRELDGLNSSIPIQKIELKKRQLSENRFVKINFDAAFRKHENKSCSRIVIRDSDGMELSSRVEINEKVPSVFIEESIARIQNIQLSLDLGLMEVKIEGDTLFVMNEVSYLLAIEGLKKGERCCLRNGFPKRRVWRREMKEKMDGLK